MLGEGEQCGLGLERVGDSQHAAVVLEAAHHAVGQRGQARLDAEDVEEVSLESGFKTVRCIVDIVAHAFGGGFEGWKIIGIFLQEIGNRLGDHIVARGERLSRRVAGFGRLKVPQLVEEFENGAANGGMMGGQIADVGVGEVGIGENIVAEHFHEIARQPRIVAFGQFSRLNPEITRDAEQQRHRDAAPIVLDEVEIGR